MRTSSQKTQLLFRTLKAFIKKKGLTYAQIASETKLTESAIKRIFSEESCGVGRLMELCEVAGLSLLDLAKMSAREGPTEYTLSPEVQKFFLENIHYFWFYRKLELHNHVDVFRTEDQLDERSLSRYLRKLESLGLIEVHPGRKIRIRNKGYINFGAELNARVKAEWTPLFVDRLLKVSDSRHSLQAVSTGLTPEHRKELWAELQAILNKFREVGQLDQKLNRDQYDSVAVLIGMGPYRIGILPTIPKLN